MQPAKAHFTTCVQLYINRYLALAACANAGWYIEDVDEYFGDGKIVSRVAEAKYTWALYVLCGGYKGDFADAVKNVMPHHDQNAKHLNTACKTRWSEWASKHVCFRVACCSVACCCDPGLHRLLTSLLLRSPRR